MDAIQRLIMIAERERCKRQYQEPSHRPPLRPAAPTASQPQPDRSRPDTTGLSQKPDQER